MPLTKIVDNVVIELTAEEIAEVEARVAAADLNFNEVRMLRSGMLAGSDWTQMVDSALTDEKKAEWATYRQELRDYPAQSDKVSTLPALPTPPS
jgi:hypothetical protein